MGSLEKFRPYHDVDFTRQKYSIDTIVWTRFNHARSLVVLNF